ncbi:MAG: hypothetical protein K2X53_02265 [Alphaproteobacteria bacterium]|nr:hypothetical protein [Alphaproteobacteria bacterium]
MIQVLKKTLLPLFLIFFIVFTLPHKLSASFTLSQSDETLTLDDIPVFNLLTVSEMAKQSQRNFYATIYLEISNTKEGYDLVKTMVRRSSKGKRRSLFYDILQKMRRGIIAIEKEYSRWDDLCKICAETYLKHSLPQLNAYKDRLDLFRTGNITFKKTNPRRAED